MTRKKFDMNSARNYSIIKREIAERNKARLDSIYNNKYTDYTSNEDLTTAQFRQLEERLSSVDHLEYLAQGYSIQSNGILVHLTGEVVLYGSKLTPSKAYEVARDCKISLKSLHYMLYNN